MIGSIVTIFGMSTGRSVLICVWTARVEAGERLQRRDWRVRTSPREHGVAFGGYRFETESGRLWSGAREIRLTPKASEVLTTLVLHAGELVSKEDLFATVWNGTAVSDDALTSCIQELRRALKDDSKEPRFIETRHRRGYRFIAPLSQDDEAPAVESGRQSSEQEIRFCTTSDGVSIAYSAVGTGPYIVRVLGHFTHLEAEWEWPDLRRFWEHLAERHTVIRYDGRGIGLSDPYAGEFTEDTRQRDLDAVLNAIGIEHAVLLGVSEGGWTAATYAIEHPTRITHLILYGAYCRGAQARPGYDLEEDQALVTLIRKGWGRDTPAFRQVIQQQVLSQRCRPCSCSRTSTSCSGSLPIPTPPLATMSHVIEGVTDATCSGSSEFRC